VSETNDPFVDRLLPCLDDVNDVLAGGEKIRLGALASKRSNHSIVGSDKDWDRRLLLSHPTPQTVFVWKAQRHNNNDDRHHDGKTWLTARTTRKGNSRCPLVMRLFAETSHLHDNFLTIQSIN